MIAIKKGEPNLGLVALQQKAKKKRLAPQEAFKTLRNPLKETIRAQMVKEQGGLCAYCMCRIPRPDVAPNIAPM